MMLRKESAAAQKSTPESMYQAVETLTLVCTCRPFSGSQYLNVLQRGKRRSCFLQLLPQVRSSLLLAAHCFAGSIRQAPGSERVRLQPAALRRLLSQLPANAILWTGHPFSTATKTRILRSRPINTTHWSPTLRGRVCSPLQGGHRPIGGSERRLRPLQPALCVRLQSRCSGGFMPCLVPVHSRIYQSTICGVQLRCHGIELFLLRLQNNS